MLGKTTPPELITPAEAINLQPFSLGSSLVRATNLYSTYEKRKGYIGEEDIFEFMCALAFVYDTGRIQGIREERARKRRKNKTSTGHQFGHHLGTNSDKNKGI